VIIEYAPPEPILILLMMDAMERAVVVVIENATTMISQEPRSPTLPTTHPSLRYIITPMIVRSVGTYTPVSIPNRVSSRPDRGLDSIRCSNFIGFKSKA
jgi:hypothetical protein